MRRPPRAPGFGAIDSPAPPLMVRTMPMTTPARSPHARSRSPARSLRVVLWLLLLVNLWLAPDSHARRTTPRGTAAQGDVCAPYTYVTNHDVVASITVGNGSNTEPCGFRSAGFQPAHVVQRPAAVGQPVVFATPFSEHFKRSAQHILTVCGRPERARRPYTSHGIVTAAAMPKCTRSLIAA